MKRLRLFLMSLMLWLLPVLAFAQATAAATSPDTGAPSLVQSFFAAVILALLSLVGLATKWLGAWMKKKTDEIDNVALRHAAQDAVLWVEDKYGPESIKGTAMLEKAAERLAQVKGISIDEARASCRVAYQNIFAPFVKTPPSGSGTQP
jgi:hypothetical protein